MAGGIGSRLWPLSTPEMPKQFIDLLGTGKTMIQLTVERFLPVCDPDKFWVVTSEKYVDIVRKQLPDIPADQILAEPEARNTAPCIAYACWKIAAKHPDANVVVTPADAIVIKKDLFAETIAKALAFTEAGDSIVTVGITPSRPETGYGYIHSAEARPGEVMKVSEFREKPNLETAKGYLADGHYFWNAGIFVWSVPTIIRELRAYAPQIAGVMDQLAPSFYTPDEPSALRRLFPTCEKISIDYAVMEKSSGIHVIAEELGWSDLGSWGSVKGHIAQDADGNAVVGKDVRLFNCKNCIVHTDDSRKVVVEGLDGYIVASSNGQIALCRLSEEQHIKEYSA